MNSPVARSACARLIVAGMELLGPEKIEQTVDSGDMSSPKEDVKADSAEVAEASCSKRRLKIVKMIASICRTSEESRNHVLGSPT
jgi:hypothetical protein